MRATYVDMVVRTGYRIKTCCIDDDIKFMLAVLGLDACFRDAFDGVFHDIHEVYIFAVIGLQIARLKEDTLDTNPWSLGINFSAVTGS